MKLILFTSTKRELIDLCKIEKNGLLKDHLLKKNQFILDKI